MSGGRGFVASISRLFHLVQTTYPRSSSPTSSSLVFLHSCFSLLCKASAKVIYPLRFVIAQQRNNLPPWTKRHQFKLPQSATARGAMSTTALNALLEHGRLAKGPPVSVATSNIGLRPRLMGFKNGHRSSWSCLISFSPSASTWWLPRAFSRCSGLST